MEEKLKALKIILAEIADIETAAGVLRWDRETNLPPGGTETRGAVLGTLARLAHERKTSDELGKLLEELSPWAEEEDPDSDNVRLIAYTSYEYQKELKKPAEYVVERSEKLAQAGKAWQQARAESNFSLFEPHIENVLDLMQRYADFFKPYDHPYDVLLGEYERGMKTAEVKAIFEDIRPQQVALIESIASQPQVEDSFLHQSFPVEKQLEMGREIISKFGYDFQRGRQDPVHHPFATNLGYGDQRITYRADENFLNPYLFAIMHESGHAMYEQGIPKHLWRTSLYRGTSSGFHESQSRLWENLVGRSKAFWAWYYPKLQTHFPSQLENVSQEAFYKAVNKVQPTTIRVEADEATYNLHIMLRLEIEIGLLDGEFRVKDLPEVWNTRFQEYLGVTPPDDAQGVLQDVHWSWGLFGHFVTYSLGNIIGAQLWQKAEDDISTLEENIRQGEFEPLHSWLVENIYSHGRKFSPQELIQRITGSKIDGGPYINYLKAKYSDIYGL